jgi:hypothetical protein
MTTEQRIEQIKERTDKATKGEWRTRSTHPPDQGFKVAEIAYSSVVLLNDDADFIANAREDVPFLLARIAELERWKRNAIEIVGKATNRPANQTEGE